MLCFPFCERLSHKLSVLATPQVSLSNKILRQHFLVWVQVSPGSGPEQVLIGDWLSSFLQRKQKGRPVNSELFLFHTTWFSPNDDFSLFALKACRIKRDRKQNIQKTTLSEGILFLPEEIWIDLKWLQELRRSCAQAEECSIYSRSQERKAQSTEHTCLKNKKSLLLSLHKTNSGRPELMISNLFRSRVPTAHDARAIWCATSRQKQASIRIKKRNAKAFRRLGFFISCTDQAP